MGSIVDNIGLGLSVAFSLENLWYCFFGVALGTFVGVLPGIGAVAAIAMLMPLTFTLDPTAALIMLAGIYYGSMYGGSTASILLNLPGSASSAVVCLDGYPMSQQGRAGIALFITTIASFFGSIVGLILLAAFSPPLARMALSFGGPEFFLLMLVGLLATVIASRAPLRALAMVCLGLLLGLAGSDINTGQMRFTYGVSQLFEGLPLVAIALGIFGLPEVIQNVGRMRKAQFLAKDITFRSMIPTRDDWKRSMGAMARGTGVGTFFGILPGTGGILASFMSYALEKRVAKEPERFGKGAIEGIVAPEASNNAAVQTGFIPTLSLGIPGDAIMAMMMGAMIVHGISPGANIMTQHADLYWGLVVSFLIGNLMLLVLNIPLISLWVRMLTIPYTVLYPFIIAFMCIGVYSVNSSVLDVFMLLLFGILGCLMLAWRFETAPLLLGFILGPMMEENLRRSLILFRGDYSRFLSRPVSAFLIAVCLLIIALVVFGLIRRLRTRTARTTV